MIKLTVVTTTYNQEKYIGRAIESFLMQKTSFNFVILISDDCSTDNTPKILKKYQAKHPDRIKVIFRENNRGAMENFVETLNKVSSEYVALCDGDDFWTDPDKLEKQVQFLEENKEYSICCHRTKIVFEDNSQPDIIYPTTYKETTNFQDLLEDNYIVANTVVYRWKFKSRDSLKNIFPKNIVPGDYLLHLFHAKEGKIKYFPEVMSVYLRNTGGMWYLTSKPEYEKLFYLKYGLKYLNFFKSLNTIFKLPKQKYNEKISYIAYRTAKYYLQAGLIDEFYNLYKENDIYLKGKLNLNSFEELIGEQPFIKRVLILFVIDKKLFFSRLTKKIKK